jgi:glucoamylase
MLFTSVLRALPATLLLVGAQGSPLTSNERRQTSLEQYLKAQADVSIKGILANIGPDGSKAQGASAGIVVASPSRTDPDCECIGACFSRDQV